MFNLHVAKHWCPARFGGQPEPPVADEFQATDPGAFMQILRLRQNQ